MVVEQAEKASRIWGRLRISNLSKRKKFLIGVTFVALYGLIIWYLISYIEKLVVTMTVIPAIGFIFLFGFWGYIAVNLSSFLVLLLTLYSYYGQLTTEILSLTEIFYILVLVIVAALISKQKEFIHRLYKQISKQKSEESKLIDSRDGYRNLIYRIPVGLYRTTPDGKILEASTALVEMLGFPDFESLSFVNISTELFVNPQDRVNENNLLQKEGVVRDYELRLFKRDGEMIWIRDNVRAVKDENGQILCYEGSLEDITERKLMEAAEREQRVLAEALRDTAAALSGTLEFDEVLDRILINMGHVVPHDAANIMLAEKGLAKIERSKGYIYDWEEEVRQASRFLIEDIPTLKHMHESGKPLAIPDTHESDLWVNLPHTEWMRSYAGAPIRLKGKTIGFLNLNSATPGFFTQTKAEWLQAFADQAGVAIENARMFGEIHENARQTALLNAITQTTIMAPDLEGMIQILVDRLGELISADGAYITLWDEDKNRVTPGAAYGPLRDSFSEINVEANEKTITSLVLAEGKSLVLKDAELASLQIKKSSKNCRAKSILGLPLIADEKKLGAVLITYDQPHHFSEAEISLSEQAARIIALAIYKAKLFESEKERTKELARANTIITALGNAATQVEAAIKLDRMVEILGEVLADLGLHSMVLLQSSDGENLGIHQLSESVHLVYSGAEYLHHNEQDYQLPPSGFAYYNEVINQKQIIFLENVYEMIGSIFPYLDELGPEEFDTQDSPQPDSQGFLLPLVPGKKVIGCLLIWGPDMNNQDIPAFSLFASQISVAIENARLMEKIQQIAITDDLTGLYNRRGLYEVGRLEIERTLRYEMPLAAIVMDIDHFKRVNDQHSHAIGDQVLRSFAKCVQENTRELDVVGRIGGEEFVILLPGSNHKSAQRTAARLQKLIANNVTHTSAGEIKITVSQGVAILDDSMQDLNDLVKAADRALYRAKETGRNRVVSSAFL
ncbi:MAG: diguanylate cyclase [Chloroflexi bacterium]|nr:diguanylate cyclase [Chloroflexota bacterium]